MDVVSGFATLTLSVRENHTHHGSVVTVEAAQKQRGL